jgi:hypothetical protein
MVLGGADDRAARPPTAVPLTPAIYDGTFTFENGRWAVHETYDVPLPGPRGHPATLSRGWNWVGPGSGKRRGTYARSRTIAAHVSFWPFRRVTNQFAVPQPRLPGAQRRRFVAADESRIYLTGPRRLVGDTTPAAFKRTPISGNRETVELRLVGLRYNPDRRRVEMDLANSVGRSGLYAAALKYGLIGLGLIITGTLGFFVQRWLTRRFGDGSQAAPQPARATTA